VSQRASEGSSATEPARPASLEEAASLFAAASAERRQLRIGADLTTERLDRVLEHEAGDLTCTVEAGVRLSALRSVLTAAGQRLSLDPPGDPTVGGCLAQRLSGPLSHRFGTPRDLVLGVTLVLGDGTVCSSGGKVVKNVAGYDLGKLVCGSEGRLALIGRVALRLHPLPVASGTVVVETAAPAEVVRALRRSQLQPSALDVLHPGRVAVLYEGSERAVTGQVEATQALVGGVASDAAVWDEARERQGRALGRLTFAPGELANVLTTLGEAVVRPGAGVAYVPHRVGGVPDAAARRIQRALKERLDPAAVLA
jgi:glycolate oxidase FAD binding subunit